MLRLLIIAKLQHAWHVTQRVNVRVLAGIALILLSHMTTNEVERVAMRDAGTGIIAYAITRWLQHQGARRVDPRDGKPKRNPTLRFMPPKDRP